MNSEILERTNKKIEENYKTNEHVFKIQDR